MPTNELPSNIKQIGSISEGLRIYIEDYVFSYLQQYAEAGGYDERIAILVGRCLIIDGIQALFISGAIEGRDPIRENGLTLFSEASMEYINEMMDKHFKGFEIVGWVQTQPSYGTALNSNYEAYHKASFQNTNDVMYVIDPIEKVNAFYTYSDDKEKLTESKGYFIYYEKNTTMHDYIIEHKPIIMDFKAPPKVVKPTLVAAGDDTPESILLKRKIERAERKAVAEQRKISNLLIGVSAVLLLVCFIMGTGLIQNGDRISSLEQQLVQLSTAYKNLVLQITQDNAASVFAAQNDTGAALTEDNGNNELSQNTQEIGDIEVVVLTPTFEATPVPTPEATPIPTPAPTAIPPVPTPISEAPVSEIPVTVQTVSTPEPIVQAVRYPNVPDTYSVEKGDSLSYISQKFYGSIKMIDEIMSLNGIDSPEKLYYGKVIKLPK